MLNLGSKSLYLPQFLNKNMIRIQVGNTAAGEYSDADIQQFKDELDIREIGDKIYSIIYQNKSYEISIAKVDSDAKQIYLTIDGIQTQVKYADKMTILLEKMGIDTAASNKLSVLKAPMPGLVVEWLVQEGDEVKQGDKLLILEAMKMENVIKASGEGKIKKIHIAKGTAVEKNQVLIDFA